MMPRFERLEICEPFQLMKKPKRKAEMAML
jgi:hypothetical protein